MVIKFIVHDAFRWCLWCKLSTSLTYPYDKFKSIQIIRAICTTMVILTEDVGGYGI